MNSISLTGMLEATRLTRAGQLTEATRLLQHLLQGRTVPDHAPIRVKPTPLPLDGGAETIGAADAAALHTAPAGGIGVRRHRLGATGAGALPAMFALRSFLEQDKRTGFAAPLSGLGVPAPAEEATVLPDGAQFLSATFNNPAGTRPYKLYVPSGYQGQPVPLIVMLHGCTQSPDDFAAGTRMNAAGGRAHCLVAYPGADQRRQHRNAGTGSARRPAARRGRALADCRDHPRDHARLCGSSDESISRAFRRAARPPRSWATYPTYAAIGVHSGLACGAASDMPSAFAAMRQGRTVPSRTPVWSDIVRGRSIVPAIVFHGDCDTTVHPCNGDDVVTQSTFAMSLETQVEEGHVSGGHAYIRSRHIDTSGQTLIEQWLIHGAGHAWSGGSPAGSYTDPRGPDATKEMLRFFLDHPRPIDITEV